jgi:hypothetical protein
MRSAITKRDRSMAVSVHFYYFFERFHIANMSLASRNSCAIHVPVSVSSTTTRSPAPAIRVLLTHKLIIVHFYKFRAHHPLLIDNARNTKKRVMFRIHLASIFQTKKLHAFTIIALCIYVSMYFRFAIFSNLRKSLSHIPASGQSYVAIFIFLSVLVHMISLTFPI